MGLPEVVGSSSIPGKSSALYPVPQSSYSARLGRSNAFVLLGTHSYDDKFAGLSLGHQFLLGFIPFTRVFLEHGPERFLTEVFIQVLLDEGHRVLEVPASQMRGVPPQVPLSAALTLSVEELRVNAYDAVFFRIADVAGRVLIRYLSPSNFTPLRQEEFALDATEYRRQAQAPVLSSMLQRNFRTAAQSLLQRGPSHRISRVLTEPAVDSVAASEMLWLFTPVFEKPPAPAIGEYLSASYGFASVPALPPPAILRLVQRGMGGELFRVNTAFVSVLDAGDDLSPDRALRVFVKRLEVEDSKRIVLETRFREEADGVVQREGNCAITLSELGGVDGAAVITLEQAAALSLRAFLHLPDGESGADAPVTCAEG